MKNAGYTLIEMLVVVLIIGILAGAAVPSYMKSVETTKADDAVALVNMIGTTNRMFALDHGGINYVVGTFPGSVGTASATCPAAACPTAAPYGNACILVNCKYLANQDFGAKTYRFDACNPAGACNATPGNSTASAKRKSGTYVSWAYGQDRQGVITAYGTAPTPSY